MLRYIPQLIIVLLFCGASALQAQSGTYPVTAALQTLPPFTPNLTDWSDPLNNRLGLTLLLNDRREPGFQVYLRLTIEGQGIRLRSNDQFVPNPIALSFGAPVRLTASELLEYFDLNNLTFSGISRQQYLDQGGLPEGTYSICFETVDVIRSGDGPASLPACSFVQARTLDPPVILSPIGQQAAISPQMLFIQWQARHTASFMTDYTVEIYENDPELGLTPDQIFSLQQPYIEQTISGITSLNVDLSYPLLKSGESYFVRVRAADPMGVADFKNGGYSELAFFTYGTACVPPTGINIDVQSHSEARMNWNFQPGSEKYVVRYKEDDASANWYEKETFLNREDLSELKDSTVYLLQVQSLCGGTPGSFSPVFEFTTPSIPFDPTTFDCGETIEDLPLPTNREPISALQYGELVKVGNFDLRITSAEQGDGGLWEGTGQIRIGWLGQRVNCTFADLGINTDRRVYEGSVEGIDEGLERLEGYPSIDSLVSARDTAGMFDFCWDLNVEEPDTNGINLPEADANFDEENFEARLFNGGTNLPVAVGGSELTQVVLYGMSFGATGATLNAFSTADLPATDLPAMFVANDIGFQPGGLQGESKMELLNDFEYAWTDNMRVTLREGEDNFVAFDCSGITEVGVDMVIDFCQKFILPVDPATNEVENVPGAYVQATFIARAPSWTQFTGDLSITPFQLAKLPGWTFTIDNAVLDLSEETTPESVTFPEDYVHPDLGEDGELDAWQGFYLKEGRVTLPAAFSGISDTNSSTRDANGNEVTPRRDSSQTVSMGVADLIIDETGFSGALFGLNLMTLEEGRAGTWAMSIDTVAIGIQSNQFSHANMGGEVEVPALDAPLAYACHIQPGSEYAFSIGLTDTVSMSAMRAKVDLFQNTEIGLSLVEEEDESSIEAYVILHGEASFSAGTSETKNTSPQDTVGKSKMKIPGIRFEGFHLKNTSPYLEDVGTWSLASEEPEGKQPKTGGFPLTINEVGMMRNEEATEIAFGIDLSVNLVKSKDKGFGARGRAFIICDIGVNPETQKEEWSFNRVRMDRLDIDYVGSGFEFHGFLEQFEEDPVYGTGFSGGIQANFTPGLSVGVVGIFGKKEDYRYFFADALVAFDPGIALGQSGMSLYGFGGGVSYHMERQGFSALELPPSEATEGADTTATTPPEGADPAQDPATAGADTTATLQDAFAAGLDPSANRQPAVPMPEELGVSLSGVRYIPNETVGIGIKAMVAFGTVRREVFNGDITFEVMFNTDGGMRYVGLSGNANFLTPPKTAAEPNPEASISAYVDMGYDFNNESFDAYLRLQVYLAEGVLAGAYPNNVAGEGKVHASADDWYIYLGLPDQPIKISYDPTALANVAAEAVAGGGSTAEPLDSTSRNSPLGGLDEFGITMTAYLDAGTKLPAFPDPPEKVTSILGEGDYNPTGRDDPAFADATGLLFGAGFEISMPNLSFLVFYAYLEAGLGFDMMMKDYGMDARCAGDENNPGPIGMNGWYATGQMYGYLEAGVGIEVDIIGFKGKYPVFDVAAAALLQARLPNPMWMKGQLAGNYSILNGLVSGSCEFEFEAGTKCDIVSGEADRFAVIQSLAPDEGSEDVSVFVRPQATFILPIDRSTVLKDEEEKMVELRPELVSFTLTDITSGTNLPGTLEWAENHATVAFRADDILPGERQVKAEVKVTLKKSYGNDVWEPVMELGIPVLQTKTVTFTTGLAPDHIVEDNVKFAYPVNRQANFHRSEVNQGYVQLDRGQDYLFQGQSGNSLDPEKWTQKIRFWQDEAPISETDFIYNGTANQLRFVIPSGSLRDEEVSYLELVNVPTVVDDAVDVNVEEVREDLAASLPDGQLPDENTTSIMVKIRRTQGTIEGLKEKQIYRLDFRTSQYATFVAKAEAMVRKFDFRNIQALTTPPTPVVQADGTIFTGPFLSIDDFGRIFTPTEAFGKMDLKGEQLGVKDNPPLIRGSANLGLTADNWYNTRPKPNVYDRFPQPALGLELNWRDVEPDGEPPVRAVRFRLNNASAPLYGLSDYNISSRTYSSAVRDVQVRYNLPYVMYRDFADYWNQTGSLAGRGAISADLQNFLNWQFIYPSYGNYQVSLEYVLPGRTSASSRYTFLLPYSLNPSKK